MRVETIHGRHLLCGFQVPLCQIKEGQEWAPAAGGNYTVKVEAVENGWVTYSWAEKGERRSHQKTACGFQARYCLVLATPEEIGRFQP